MRFATIGLITKPEDERLADTVHALIHYLRTREASVLIDENVGRLVQGWSMQVVSRSVIAERCDLVIVVGGDGTFLNAARSLVDRAVPILGINRGRLGFLVDISPEDMIRHLDDILAGAFREDRRFLLQAELWRGDQLIAQGPAFNDVVVRVSGVVRLIELETLINDRFVNHLRADGLIVATPTGSTAYALSGGGPILYPSLEAIVLVPICPHTLSNRPIVVAATSRIEIVFCRSNQVPAEVSFDGQADFRLKPEDRIRIWRKETALRLIQPQDHDYFEILRAKLRWG